MVDLVVSFEALEILRRIVADRIRSHDQFILRTSTIRPDRFNNLPRQARIVSVSQNTDRNLWHVRDNGARWFGLVCCDCHEERRRGGHCRDKIDTFNLNVGLKVYPRSKVETQ